MISDFVVFLAVSVCLHNGLGYAFNIEIIPNKVNGLMHNDVSVTCRLHHSDTDVKEIVLIDVFTKGNAIAIFRLDSTLTIAEGLENQLKAQGKMSKSIHENYLTVVMSNPGMKDSGEYTCVVYYLDDTNVLKEKRISANLTVTNEEVKSTLRYLVDEVSALKSQLSGEKAKSVKLQDKIVSQEKHLNQLEKKENTTVTFTALHTTSGALNVNDVIVFNDVISNEGQGYDGNTGVFTAPVAGYYVFHLSVNVPGGRRIFFDLTSNKGQILIRINVGDHDWQNHSGGSCVAKLELGEEIKPVIRYTHANPTMYHYTSGDRMNQFSGYLLKTL